MRKSIPTNFHATLYDASYLSQQIESALIETDGEITPEIQELLDFKEYDALMLKDSVDIIGFTLDRLDLNIDYYQQQIDTLKKLQDSAYKAKETIVSNITSSMNRLKIDSIEGLYRKMKFRQNPPKLEILDELSISDEFKVMKITEHIKNDEIKAFLKKGGKLDWARLTQGRSLKIETLKPSMKERNNE